MKLYLFVSSVPFRWYSSWQRYISQSSNHCITNEKSLDSHSVKLASATIVDRPGPIDNYDILSNDNNGESDDLVLRRLLEEGRDYVLVPEEVWEKLFNW